MLPPPTVHFEAASTLAIVLASHEPLLFMSDDLTVIAASASFCRVFGVDPRTVAGRRLDQLGSGEWAMPTLLSLLRATASGQAQIEAYEIDLQRPGEANRHLVVNAHLLDDGDTDRVGLLLALTEVTQARAEMRLRDDLIRDNAVLLQEVQHRVANSLQIIASVLMQSVRKVQSEEAPGASAQCPSSRHVDCRPAAAALHLQRRPGGTPTLFHPAVPVPGRLDDCRSGAALAERHRG